MSLRRISLLFIYEFMKWYFLYALVVVFLVPETTRGQTVSTAEDKANLMFRALGGKEKWASLKSLYIKATHTEPSLEEPYQSEIWRGIDEFKLRIEQQSGDFHNLGLFSEEGGWVFYKKKDSKRVLTQVQLEDEKLQHEHNIYVLLNKIASTNQYKAVLNGQRLEFHKGESFAVAFILDEKHRPEIFITKRGDGTENVSHFECWNNTDGLIHPAGGGPVDGNFRYVTEVWLT